MERPEELKPGKTTAELTAEAASEFASLADRLRVRGHEPHAVAHFLNKLVFCMFAEDARRSCTGIAGCSLAAGPIHTDVWDGRRSGATYTS